MRLALLRLGGMLRPIKMLSRSVQLRSRASHRGEPLYKTYRGFFPGAFCRRPRLASASKAALSAASSNFDSTPNALFACLKVKLATFPLALSTRFCRGRLVATALLDVQDRARCSVEASADWYTSGWLCFTI